MQSKNKIQTQPIEDFIAKHRVAKSKNQPTVVLTLREADALAQSLSQTMTRLVSIQEEIIETLKTAQQAQTVNVEMDGGNFSKK
jgi:methanogenic corrinoid protein MtbC1